MSKKIETSPVEAAAPAAVAAPSVAPPVVSFANAPQKYTALPNTFHIAEHKRGNFVLEVPADVAFEDVLSPGAFSNIIGRQNIGPAARIEVWGGGRQWWAELLVLKVDAVRRMVWTHVLHEPVSFKVDRAGDADALTVDSTSGGRYWRVLRGRKVLKDRFESEAEAMAWARGQAN